MSEVSRFACPSCGKEFRWKLEMAGRRAKCKCGGTIEVPATDPAATPPPPPPVPEGEPSFDDVFALADGAEASAPPPPPPPPTQGGRQRSAAASSQKSSRSQPATPAGVPLPRRAKADNTPSKFERTQHFWKGVGYTVGGVALTGYSYFEFTVLSRLEEEGGTHRMRAWVRLLYSIGGKWAVLLILGGMGVLVVLFGVMVILGKVDPNTDD